jgi:hypothetical protein
MHGYAVVVAVVFLYCVRECLIHVGLLQRQKSEFRESKLFGEAKEMSFVWFLVWETRLSFFQGHALLGLNPLQ